MLRRVGCNERTSISYYSLKNKRTTESERNGIGNVQAMIMKRRLNGLCLRKSTVKSVEGMETVLRRAHVPVPVLVLVLSIIIGVGIFGFCPV